MKNKLMLTAVTAAMLFTACSSISAETNTKDGTDAETDTITEIASETLLQNQKPADSTPQTSKTADFSQSSAETEISDETNETALVTDKSNEAEDISDEDRTDTYKSDSSGYDAVDPDFTMTELHNAAEGDIITISVSSNYMDHTVKYGNIVFLEKESTSGSLYFQAVAEGKDNIVISENSDDGVIIREYAVVIDEELNAEIYEVSAGTGVSPYDEFYDDDGYFYFPTPML